MASTFQTLLKLAVTTIETPTYPDLNAGTTIPHAGLDVDQVLNAASALDVTACAFDTVTMSGGTGSIDLTATHNDAAAVSLSGKKPRWILFHAPAANGAAITVAKGASTGYTGLGAAFSETLQPGDTVLHYLTAGTAVSGSVKVLDVTGTGTDAIVVAVGAGVN